MVTTKEAEHQRAQFKAAGSHPDWRPVVWTTNDLVTRSIRPALTALRLSFVQAISCSAVQLDWVPKGKFARADLRPTPGGGGARHGAVSDPSIPPAAVKRAPAVGSKLEVEQSRIMAAASAAMSALDTYATMAPIETTVASSGVVSRDESRITSPFPGQRTGPGSTAGGQASAKGAGTGNASASTKHIPLPPGFSDDGDSGLPPWLHQRLRHVPGLRLPRDLAGKPAFGPASYFVSHAWQYRFEDLVAAILSHYFSLPEVGNGHFVPIYYWMDVFAVPQVSGCMTEGFGPCVPWPFMS